MGKIICWGVFAILAVALVAFGVGGSFLIRFALEPKSRFFLKNLHMNPLKESDEKSAGFSGFPGDETTRKWYAGACGDKWMISADGLRLHAYEIRNEKGNGNYMILCHGYLSSADDMAFFAGRFYEMGYNLLLPDARAHGKSEGRMIGMGWPERKDIVRWSDILLKEHPETKIGWYGISMGGATVMMAAGEELPDGVTAVIEDCGYSSVWDEFAPLLKKMFHLPEFPLLYMASLICRMRAGYGFKEASAVKQVTKADVPILFIHGMDDRFVPFEMLEQVYEAARCEKEKLEVPEAGHGMAGAVMPETYWRKVKDFLERHM